METRISEVQSKRFSGSAPSEGYRYDLTAMRRLCLALSSMRGACSRAKLSSTVDGARTGRSFGFEAKNDVFSSLLSDGPVQKLSWPQGNFDAAPTRTQLKCEHGWIISIISSIIPGILNASASFLNANSTNTTSAKLIIWTLTLSLTHSLYVCRTPDGLSCKITSKRTPGSILGLLRRLSLRDAVPYR